jgi:hypothetical protein
MINFSVGLDELRFILQKSIKRVVKTTTTNHMKSIRLPYFMGMFNEEQSEIIENSLYSKYYIKYQNDELIFDDRILSFTNSWLTAVSYIQLRDSDKIRYYFFGSLFDVCIEILPENNCEIYIFIEGGTLSHLMNFVYNKHIGVDYLDEETLENLEDEPVDASETINYTIYLSDLQSNPVCLLNEFARKNGGVIAQTVEPNESEIKTFICNPDYTEMFVNRIFQIRYNI